MNEYYESVEERQACIRYLNHLREQAKKGVILPHV